MKIIRPSQFVAYRIKVESFEEHDDLTTILVDYLQRYQEGSPYLTTVILAKRLLKAVGE